MYEGTSTEFIIYELVYAKLIEQSGEWTAAQKQRVRNLLGSMRLAGLPNMHDREQAMINVHAVRGFFSKTEYEINPTTVADVRSVWSTFGLARPSVTGLPAPTAEAISGFFPPELPALEQN